MKNTTSTPLIFVLASCACAIVIGLLAGITYYLIPQSADGLYTMTTVVIAVLLPFIFAPALYNYLRRQRTKNSEILTTLALALGFVVGLAVALTSFGNVSGWKFVLQASLIGLPLQFLICLAASTVAKKLYDRRHNMSIE